MSSLPAPRASLLSMRERRTTSRTTAGMTRLSRAAVVRAAAKSGGSCAAALVAMAARRSPWARASAERTRPYVGASRAPSVTRTAAPASAAILSRTGNLVAARRVLRGKDGEGTANRGARRTHQRSDAPWNVRVTLARRQAPRLPDPWPLVAFGFTEGGDMAQGGTAGLMVSGSGIP